MKAQKTNNQGVYLQSRNNRWKWMAGATAATAVGVTSSQASTITINLVNNYISTFYDNHLNADLTGDGHPDLSIANAYTIAYRASVTLNGVRAHVRYDTGAGGTTALYVHMELGSRAARFYSYPYYQIRSGTYSLTGSIPIFFKDLHINGGAPTSGSLEVTLNRNGIQLDSFAYNTPDQRSTRAVPDQGSTLALLAMGAGGILAFRRWRATRAQP